MEIECDEAGPSEPALFQRQEKIRSSQMSNGQNAKAPAVSWNVSCVKGLLRHCTRGSGLTGQQTPSAPLRQQIVRSFCLRLIRLPSLFCSNPPLRCGQTGSARYLVRMIAPPSRCRRRLSASRVEWHAGVPGNDNRRATAVPERRPHREWQLPIRRVVPVHWPRSSLHWVREGTIHIALQHLHRCILLAKL